MSNRPFYLYAAVPAILAFGVVAAVLVVRHEMPGLAELEDATSTPTHAPVAVEPKPLPAGVATSTPTPTLVPVAVEPEPVLARVADLTPTPTHVPVAVETDSATAGVEDQTTTPVPIAVEPVAQEGDEPEPVKKSKCDGYTMFHGEYMLGLDIEPTLAEIVLKADVIARVKLQEVQPAAARKDQDGQYTASLRFTLQILDYLKGDGGPQLSAYAYGWDQIEVDVVDEERCEITNDVVNRWSAPTEAAALAKSESLSWDARWEDREAIVFLRLDEVDGRYYLGPLEEADRRHYYSHFTGWGELWQSWLPDALGEGEQHFLLNDPEKFSPVPTIGLSDMKALVAALDREYNGGDGSAEYKTCVIAKYEWESQSQYETARNGGEPIRAVYLHTLNSGEPAGVWIHSLPGAYESLQEHGDTVPPEYGQYWTEGRGKDLLVGNRHGAIATARPLPAGEYSVFELWRSRKYVPCDAMPEARRTKFEHLLTVTAPVGTLAESFFDPYADREAVTGNTTVGSIKWEAGEVHATLTQDFAGCVDDHVLDFISLDGSVSFSLAVPDAVKGAGTLVWTVPDQPWSTGDKLMLRVRRTDASPVIPPAGTPERFSGRYSMVSETTFDPYADGAAVTGATPFGTIRWEPGRITAAPTQDPTGCVQVRVLDLSGLEFLGQDGTLFLVLDVRDAVRDGETLTWPVSSQPWLAGAKLTLRIHRPPNVP